MEIIIEDKIRECNKNITETSIKSYIANLKKLTELLKITDLNIFYKDYETIINFIKKEYASSDNSQRNKLTAANAMVKCLFTDNNKKEIEKVIDIYKNELSILKIKIDERLATHKKSKHEEETWIDKKDEKLIKNLLLEKVPDEINTYIDLSKLRDYVLFIFYQNLSTRTELADSKIFYDDEVDIDNLIKDNNLNYIILKKKEKKVVYILNNYKTIKKYGHVILDVKGNMYSLLARYKDNLDKLHDDNYFILGNSGKKVSRTSLSLIYTNLGHVIGRRLSIRTARHIKVTNNVNIKKVNDLATEMRHDPTTALSIYAKHR